MKVLKAINIKEDIKKQKRYSAENNKIKAKKSKEYSISRIANKKKILEKINTIKEKKEEYLNEIKEIKIKRARTLKNENNEDKNSLNKSNINKKITKIIISSSFLGGDNKKLKKEKEKIKTENNVAQLSEENIKINQQLKEMESIKNKLNEKNKEIQKLTKDNGQYETRNKYLSDKLNEVIEELKEAKGVIDQKKKTIENLKLIDNKNNEEKYNPLEFNYIDSGIDNIGDEKEICEDYYSENSIDKDNSKKSG